MTNNEPTVEGTDAVPLRVARVVTSAESHPLLQNEKKKIPQARACLLEACETLRGRVAILQTAGGFLWLLRNLKGIPSGPKSTPADFARVRKFAEEAVADLLNRDLLDALRSKSQFLTLGVDVHHRSDDLDTHGELVATVDTKTGKVIGWTGKSQPTETQRGSLVYCADLESHFQKMGPWRVLVLGCHDLNIYSNRSRASVAEGSYKAIIQSRMQALTDAFRPEIVLAHPHGTDSPKIWQVALSGIKESIRTARLISIGIHYENLVGGDIRGRLDDVLRQTTRGNIVDVVVKGASRRR